jgi:hypothetical protein
LYESQQLFDALEFREGRQNCLCYMNIRCQKHIKHSSLMQRFRQGMSYMHLYQDMFDMCWQNMPNVVTINVNHRIKGFAQPNVGMSNHKTIDA